MTKRVISLILSMVMILSLMPMNIAVSAEEIPAEDPAVVETTAPAVEETVPEVTAEEATVPETEAVLEEEVPEEPTVAEEFYAEETAPGL